MSNSITQSCAACGAQTTTATAYICHDCTAELATLLDELPKLMHELTLTLTGQQRFEQQASSSKSSEQALPFNIAASYALAELHTQIRRLIERCHAAHVHDSASIAAHEWAAETLHNLRRASAHATRVIDRPADRTFAGPCDECGRDLYAKPDATTVDCTTCGLTYDVRARREWLLRVIDDQLATATEIARALTSLDLPVTSERIWQWRHRDRIEQRGTDRRGRPMYRVGDVVTLLIEHAEKHSA